jgi:hypothetical protein
MAAIGKATIGVVFLSTPHRGTSPLAIWNEALPTTPPNTLHPFALVNDIYMGSPTLTRMDTAFNLGVIDRLQVYTFFEDRTTKFMALPDGKVSSDHHFIHFSPRNIVLHAGANCLLRGFQIVENISASLGHKNERRQSLDTEHYWMTKFPSNAHPAYTRVASAIFEIFDNNRKGKTVFVPNSQRFVDCSG